MLPEVPTGLTQNRPSSPSTGERVEEPIGRCLVVSKGNGKLFAWELQPFPAKIKSRGKTHNAGCQAFFS